MSLLRPLLRPSLRPLLRSLDGQLSSVALAMAVPANDGTISLAGTSKSAPVFARTSTGYAQDWENVYRLAQAGEARFKGARRVENLCKWSDDLTNVVWGGVAVASASDTITNFNGAAGDRFSQNIVASSVMTGRQFRLRLEIKGDAGKSVNTFLKRIGGTSNSTVSITVLDGTWQKVCSPVWTGLADNTGVSAFFGAPGGDMNLVPATLQARNMQVEEFTAQTNQNPGEYIPTTSATAAKYFWRTNGNTVASNVVTEATGLNLHPASTKDGKLWFDHYRSRANSTAYAVGQRIIPIGGAYTGGSNGYWYECTAITTGISAASAPTWPTTGFGSTTVVDGGVTWRIGGYFRIAGYYTEGQRINSLLHSRDFGNEVWVTTGTGTATQNAVGFAGAPNMAWTLTDSDAAATYQKAQALTVPNDGNTHVESIIITKDAITSRFPEFHVALTGGTLVERAVQINTQTGAVATRLTAGTGTVYVEDKGDRWLLVISLTNNTTGNITKTARLLPAGGSSAIGLGVADISATGSCVFDQAQIELNVGAVKIASSPIPTTTVAVTRAADTLNISKIGHFDPLKGSAQADFEPVQWSATGSLQVIASEADQLLYARINTAGVGSNPGGGQALGPTGVPIGTVRGGSRWGGANGFTHQVSANGANGEGATATDDHDVTATLQVGAFVSGTQPFFGAIRNIRMYTADPGTAKLNELTKYDFDQVA